MKFSYYINEKETLIVCKCRASDFGEAMPSAIFAVFILVYFKQKAANSKASKTINVSFN